jgi:formylmethanofuran dehydrogenase subunit A
MKELPYSIRGENLVVRDEEIPATLAELVFWRRIQELERQNAKLNAKLTELSDQIDSLEFANKKATDEYMGLLDSNNDLRCENEKLELKILNLDKSKE